MLPSKTIPDVNGKKRMLKPKAMPDANEKKRMLKPKAKATAIAPPKKKARTVCSIDIGDEDDMHGDIAARNSSISPTSSLQALDTKKVIHLLHCGCFY
jgi:hypothetical protein